MRPLLKPNRWLIPWLILATLLSGTSKASEKTPDGGVCYTKDEIDELADSIQRYEACKIDNEMRRQFIEQKMDDFAAASSPLWWQNPTVVVGGVVVGFSMGVLIGVLAMQGH